MNKYEELNKLKGCKTVCIVGHANSDPDAFASMVLMKNFIRKTFKITNIDLFADTTLISKGNQLLMEDNVLNTEIKPYDACIMVDTPNIKRIGKFEDLFNLANLKINIDHHATNTREGDINFVEICSSTCELVYSILREFNYNLSTSEKEKVYAGIITDTNNFSVGNFDKSSLDTVSSFIDEIDRTKIQNLFFSNNSLKNMKVLSFAINNIESYFDGKLLFTYISHELAKSNKFTLEDYVGVINRLATIENNIFVCFAYPKDDCFYVSMRAKDGYNVAEIARENGGGGHVGAAAFDSPELISKIRNTVVNSLQNQLEEQPI